MKMTTVDIMCWFNRDGETHFMQVQRAMFDHDIEWVTRQYAEVNNGKCETYVDGKLAYRFGEVK